MNEEIRQKFKDTFDYLKKNYIPDLHQPLGTLSGVAVKDNELYMYVYFVGEDYKNKTLPNKIGEVNIVYRHNFGTLTLN